LASAVAGGGGVIGVNFSFVGYFGWLMIQISNVASWALIYQISKITRPL